MPAATNLGRSVTYRESPTHKVTQDPLITWSCKRSRHRLNTLYLY